MSLTNRHRPGPESHSEKLVADEPNNTASSKPEDPLGKWETRIIRWGLFLVFVVTFGDFVIKKIWLVVGGWLN